MCQAEARTEEKALRQRGRRKTYLGSGTFHFQLRLSALMVLTAVLASAGHSRETEAHRSSGSEVKRPKERGKGKVSNPETSKEHLTHLSSSTFISKHRP